MDDQLIEGTRTLLAAYLEGLAEGAQLTLYLVSGQKLHIKRDPGQGDPSIWYDLIDIGDNDISVRLDQIAAIRDVEGGDEGPVSR